MNKSSFRTRLLASRFALALAFGVVGTLAVAPQATQAETGFPEKEELKFGFIKLTDMAPLAVAYEKG
ncbi:MAG: ABC transporter substrate-binding protein, partial [Limnobacter sp.]|nr:ABC transporter substrate-binding protein [Limnobacter sp.]